MVPARRASPLRFSRRCNAKRAAPRSRCDLQPAADYDGDMNTGPSAGQRQDAIGRIQRYDPQHHAAGAIGEVRHQRDASGTSRSRSDAGRAQVAANQRQHGEDQPDYDQRVHQVPALLSSSI